MNVTAFAILVLGSFFGLTGCSTKPVVTDITGSTATSLAGIPFRLSTDHEVRVYRLKDDDDSYALVAVSKQRLADTSRLFAMNYQGMTFATNSLKVVQNGDNTLKSVQVTSTDSTPGTIDSLTRHDDCSSPPSMKALAARRWRWHTGQARSQYE